MNCPTCNKPLKLKRMVFRNGTEHFHSWCSNCRKGKYHLKTPENIAIFGNLPPTSSKGAQRQAKEFGGDYIYGPNPKNPPSAATFKDPHSAVIYITKLFEHGYDFSVYQLSHEWAVSIIYTPNGKEKAAE